MTKYVSRSRDVGSRIEKIAPGAPPKVMPVYAGQSGLTARLREELVEYGGGHSGAVKHGAAFANGAEQWPDLHPGAQL